MSFFIKLLRLIAGAHSSVLQRRHFFAFLHVFVTEELRCFTKPGLCHRGRSLCFPHLIGGSDPVNAPLEDGVKGQDLTAAGDVI